MHTAVQPDNRCNCLDACVILARRCYSRAQHLMDTFENAENSNMIFKRQQLVVSYKYYLKMAIDECFWEIWEIITK